MQSLPDTLAPHSNLEFLAKISQLIVLITPILYILEVRWIEALYREIGAGWAASFLTFEQIIYSSSPMAGIFLFQMIIALQLLYTGAELKTSFKFSLATLAFIIAIPLTIFIYKGLSLSYYLSCTVLAVLYSFAGWFAAAAFHLKASAQPISKKFGLFGFVILGGLITMPNTLAKGVAEFRMNNPEFYYPEISTDWTFGQQETTRLIGPTGDKLLLSITNKNEVTKFKLVQDISKNTIKQTNPNTMMNFLFLPL